MDNQNEISPIATGSCPETLEATKKALRALPESQRDEDELLNEHQSAFFGLRYSEEYGRRLEKILDGMTAEGIDVRKPGPIDYNATSSTGIVAAVLPWNEMKVTSVAGYDDLMLKSVLYHENIHREENIKKWEAIVKEHGLNPNDCSIKDIFYGDVPEAFEQAKEEYIEWWVNKDHFPFSELIAYTAEIKYTNEHLKSEMKPAEEFLFVFRVGKKLSTYLKWVRIVQEKRELNEEELKIVQEALCSLEKLNLKLEELKDKKIADQIFEDLEDTLAMLKQKSENIIRHENGNAYNLSETLVAIDGYEGLACTLLSLSKEIERYDSLSPHRLKPFQIKAKQFIEDLRRRKNFQSVSYQFVSTPFGPLHRLDYRHELTDKDSPYEMNEYGWFGELDLHNKATTLAIRGGLEGFLVLDWIYDIFPIKIGAIVFAGIETDFREDITNPNAGGRLEMRATWNIADLTQSTRIALQLRGAIGGYGGIRSRTLAETSAGLQLVDF